jgi:hypothetical protein
MKYKKILLVIFFLTLFVFQQVQAGATLPSKEKTSPNNVVPAKAPPKKRRRFVIYDPAAFLSLFIVRATEFRSGLRSRVYPARRPVHVKAGRTRLHP